MTTPPSSPEPPIVVGQAVYTWIARANRRGYGFAEVSPSLKDRIPWLEARLPRMTQFVGNEDIDESQRATYSPVGRTITDDTAVAFRKCDAGLDALGRVGRYLVHFLIGDPSRLTLSDTLRLSADDWLSGSAVPLEGLSTPLEDLSPEAVQRSAQPVALPEGAVERVVERANSFCRNATHRVDAEDLDRDELLSLLSVFPTWFDLGATLIPDWTATGPVSVLSFSPLRGHYFSIRDPRTPLADGALLGLRAMLASAADIEDCARLLGRARSTASSTVPDTSWNSDRAADEQTADAQTTVDTSPLNAIVTDDTLRLWVKNKRTTWQTRELVFANPSEVMEWFVAHGERLPDTDGADPVAIDLLRQLREIDNGQSVAKILPLRRRTAELLVKAVETPSAFFAAILLNAEGMDMRIAPPVDDPSSLIEAVEAALADETAYSGLLSTFRDSGPGGGPLCECVTGQPSLDDAVIYDYLLPDAFTGDAPNLIAALAWHPDRFLRWCKCPDPYAEALLSVFRVAREREGWRGRVASFAGWLHRTSV